MALVNYSSSSESLTSSDIENEQFKFKNKKIKCKQNKNGTKYPIPVFKKKSFRKPIEDIVIDCPDEHEGRVRSFEHVRGNWASFVFITVNLDFEELQSEIQKIYENKLSLNFSKDMHISLTKTLILRHHWINEFSESVLKLFRKEPSFQIRFGSLNVYTNEEKSRTFIGVTVERSFCFILKRLTDSLNELLNEFGLENFYSEPEFHASILWCVGNHKEYLQNKYEDLRRIFNHFAMQQDSIIMNVEKINIKIGNKYYTRILKSWP